MKINQLSPLSSKLLLLLAAIVWGFAFVAQKVGMNTIGPMAFNGIRFLLGGFTLLPFIWYNSNRKVNSDKKAEKSLWKAGLISGIVLFFAATIQQVGIIYTTAGNAGFITSFYVILVPIILVFFKHKIKFQVWIGALLALIGLYFLSVNQGFKLVAGDGLVFVSAFFWAIQVILASHYSTRFNIVKLAAIQFALTGFLSLFVSFFTEVYGMQNIYNSIIPLLYGGIFSVGLAFTFQLIGQKNVAPSHAVIILSTESLFAVIGGFLLLNEKLTSMEILGAALMLCGVLLSQIKIKMQN